ncbi:D-amino acid dehydrogenase [Nymphon striatum]|nr:D-amino acid dehydrogenase [Nymphon striatum]
MPGLWKKLPGMLLKKNGPISIQPKHFPRLIPWGIRFLMNGTHSKVEASATAMDTLNHSNVELYRKHLAGTGHEVLVKDSWYVHAFRNPAQARLDDLGYKIRKDKGAEIERIEASELRRLEPSLSDEFKAAILIKGQARAMSPGKIGEVLFKKAEGLGVIFSSAEVKTLKRNSDQSWQVETNIGTKSASQIVVAAGAWSIELLKTFGVTIPLQAERGYHVEFQNPGIEINNSIMDVDRMTVASSMKNGMRVAGTAEFTDRDAPCKCPSHRRIKQCREKDVSGFAYNNWKFKMLRSILFFVLCLSLVSCSDETDQQQIEQPVRGLKTILIKEIEQSVIRRYPSVLQPSSISTVSFEVAGRLKEVNLDVGQLIKKGEVLAEIDTRSLELQVESAEAGLEEAQSLAKNAAEDAQRKADLLKKGITSKAIADQSRTDAETSAARVVQSQRSLDTAIENLTKAKLLAPFDGIINSVEVQSFTNVTAGAAIATVYAAEAFETNFSVSFDIVNRLAVGKKVRVRLADNPEIILSGHVSELGARADTVSSFPVVVKMDETDPSIKAGMAVEISMDFTVPSGQGIYPSPFSFAIRRRT